MNFTTLQKSRLYYDGFSFKKLNVLIYVFLKLCLFSVLFTKHDTYFVCSNERKKYLIKYSSKFINIYVLKNKPLFEIFEPSTTVSDDFLLAGSLNSRTDFMVVYNYALNANLKIHCYGQNSSDAEWLSTLDSDIVKVYGRISPSELSELYSLYRYSLCFYKNNSVNQKLSASSKLFEILYFGGTPCISNENVGLYAEIFDENASFITISNLGIKLPNSMNSNRDHFCFEYELDNLRNLLL